MPAFITILRTSVHRPAPTAPQLQTHAPRLAGHLPAHKVKKTDTGIKQPVKDEECVVAAEEMAVIQQQQQAEEDRMKKIESARYAACSARLTFGELSISQVCSM